jgi:hypothetical protein
MAFKLPDLPYRRVKAPYFRGDALIASTILADASLEEILNTVQPRRVLRTTDSRARMNSFVIDFIFPLASSIEPHNLSATVREDDHDVEQSKTS